MKKLLLVVLLSAPCWAQEGYSPTHPFPVPVANYGPTASSSCPDGSCGVDPRSYYYYGPGTGYYYNYGYGYGYGAVGGGNSNPNFPGTRTTTARTTGKDLLPGYQTERGAWRR